MYLWQIPVFGFAVFVLGYVHFRVSHREKK
jgi:hypothetical protein